MMNLARRYLRLAFLFLAISLTLLVTAFVIDHTVRARFYVVESAAVRQAGVTADYAALLDSLPRPSGWIEYNINAYVHQATPFHVREVASLMNPAQNQSIVQILRELGVVSVSGSGYGLSVVEGTSYVLNYRYISVGPLIPFLGVLCWLTFWVMLALWLYEDAKQRLGRQALPWLALGLLGGPIGIVIWLIQRPPLPAPPPDCPGCHTPQVEDAAYCVACGAHLKPTCPECGRGIERGWKHCPTCGGDLNEASA